MAPPTLADVIFPEQANHNFSRILGDLKRSNLSVSNRLRSICRDAAFVDDVATALGRLPLVANERCGSWYINPARKAASAYFKSTDGHTGQWKFSTRRLNLHLLALIGDAGMPDALSKTVPIWCAVLNRTLFPSPAGTTAAAASHHHALVTPPNVVSASEASQIAALLPQFAASFAALAIDPAPLRRQLRDRPLRPFWITPEDDDDDDLALAAAGVARVARELDCLPVVCCTASRRVAGPGAEIGEGGGYVQGAADDTENWALGLTPDVFWRHRDVLLAAQESELPALIAELVAGEKEERARAAGEGGAGWEVKRVAAPGVFVGTLAGRGKVLAEGGACVVALVSGATERSEWVKGPAHLEVGLGKHKAASRQLRDALPLICEFVLRYLRRPQSGENRVVVLCESGRDLSVGVALAIYCWCFDDAGNVRSDSDRVAFNKTSIRVRLGHIVTALPEANPSRATLQSVNSFLMDWRK
ncbi:df02779a-0ee4-4ba3-a5b5-37bde53e383f [Thermothielavioides terrestris]|uniref:Df02779a-0ee4-4ba3-a5b5-37bde53e383f n=1 Tax=Thermothielavioides terrestris TaxID=2587410 RepID=A0A3S4EXN5_9PEZI|nr:df02779a-0ee4-4ba3-a5b5-37bde53e383f [Thermothielavioides terrestris]